MSTANSKLKIDFGYDSLGTSNVQGDLSVSGSLSVGGNLAFSGTTLGNFIPDQDQRSLGNTVNRWNLLGYTANIADTLTVAGSTSLQDALTVTKTINSGNVTVTGFANISTSVNSALLTVGTSFIANTTGVYHTGTINASSFTSSNSTVSGIVAANNSGVYPSSNTVGSELGTSSRRWIVNANTGDFSGQLNVSANTILGGNVTLNGSLQTIAGNVNIDSGTLFVDSVNNRVGVNNTAPTVALEVAGAANVTISVNSSLLTVGTNFVANTTGAYHTGSINAASHTVGSDFISNSTVVVLSGLANLTSATSSIRIGNSSVNSFINSSSILTGTGNFSVGANVGANVSLTNTSILIGNSTANSVVTNALVSLSNSTSSANLTPLNMVIGPSVVNSTGVFVGIGEFTSSANVGANVSINTSTVFIGNSTSNLNANSILFTISNSSFTANLSPSSLTIGTAVVNSTFIAINAGNFTSGANVGANVNLTTVALQIGNGSVNTQVNSSVLSTSIANFSTGANVGSNVKITTVLVSVGNSTVNSSVNSTTFSTGGFIANTSGITPTSNTILLGNSIGRFIISANTGDFTGAVTGISANMSTSVNSALLTVGSSFIANTTGVYHTGTINAASITIGSSSFTANSTAVVIADPLTANGSTGTAGHALISNGTSGSPYWGSPGAAIVDDTTTNASRYLLFANQTSGSLTNGYVSSTSLTFNPSTGTLTSVFVTATSDERLKYNIETVGDPIDTVNQLRGVSFNRNGTGIKDYGVIAQEIEQILPSLVHQDPEGYKSVSYNGIIGVLIEAIKQQQKQIDTILKRE